MVSPSSRQADTSKKSTSSFLERTLLTAMPKSQLRVPRKVAGYYYPVEADQGSVLLFFALPANSTGTCSVLKRMSFS
jgi:hypothetical protein